MKGLTQSDGAIGLAVERRVYELQCRGMPGAPTVPSGGYGDADGYRYLAMQRLGHTLKAVVGIMTPPKPGHVIMTSL